MIRIGMLGADGRMGQEIIKQIIALEDAELKLAIVAPSSPMKGQSLIKIMDHPKLATVIFTDDLKVGIKDVDVMIDFSTPDSSLYHAKLACEHSVPTVIGTTGFSLAQKDELEQIAKKVPIIVSPNMSIGINVVYELLALASKALSHTDIEIIEMHHRHKVDAPSGTALQLGKVICDTLGRDLQQHAIFGREGKEGPRDTKTIGFSTIRGGDVVGDHSVIFADIGERIEITHKASSRATFAKGAVQAALWLVGQSNGSYSMQDVLGFRQK